MAEWMHKSGQEWKREEQERWSTYERDLKHVWITINAVEGQ